MKMANLANPLSDVRFGKLGVRSCRPVKFQLPLLRLFGQKL